jgi:streptogramin lyase
MAARGRHIPSGVPSVKKLRCFLPLVAGIATAVVAPLVAGEKPRVFESKPLAWPRVDGAFWSFEGGLGQHQVLAVDEKTLTVTEIPIGSGSHLLAVGEGAVWVSKGKRKGALYKIDTRSRRLSGEIPIPGFPVGLAVDQGSVWVGTGEGEVVRLDARTSATVATIPVAEESVSVAARGGMVWALDIRNGVLTKIDPRANKVVGTVALGERCRGPAAVNQSCYWGPEIGEGSVWVALESKGELARIDPESITVTARIQLSGQPRSFAVGEGAVWVAVSGRIPGSFSLTHVLDRVDPRTNKQTGHYKLGSFPPSILPGVWVQNGSVWVFTPRGTAQINPREGFTNSSSE